MWDDVAEAGGNGAAHCTGGTIYGRLWRRSTLVCHYQISLYKLGMSFLF